MLALFLLRGGGDRSWRRRWPPPRLCPLLVLRPRLVLDETLELVDRPLEEEEEEETRESRRLGRPLASLCAGDPGGVRGPLHSGGDRGFSHRGVPGDFMVGLLSEGLSRR